MKAINLISVVASGLILSACASQIMAEYEGQTLVEPILDYGPPAQAFDVGDDRRAFTWVMTQTGTSPGYATTQGNVSTQFSGSTVGNSVQGSSSSIFDATTTYVPPQNFQKTCRYTLYATPMVENADEPNDWKVVGYRTPQLMCQ